MMGSDQPESLKNHSQQFEQENEAPRRKRTGYQSGLESVLYLGGHVVSPQTPLPRTLLTASG
jgi:hypothetical protein